MASPDPVALTQALIRCRSIAPQDAGALDLVAAPLAAAGFEVHRVPRGGIENLFARWGQKDHRKSFGFNGHTDVVPEGNAGEWTRAPFAGLAEEGRVWGRGAADMKSGVAAFVAAATEFVEKTPPDGAVIIAITGDEEGNAKDGTRALLDWMDRAGEAMSVCLVGEPTCPERLGDTMKIGRRGSMTAWITATGIQGHSAYPQRARNPVAAMAMLAQRLSAKTLDEGTAHFDPSTLAVTNIDTGNPANNVIPGACRATVNIRFNDAHHSDALTRWLREEAASVTDETEVGFEMDIQVSGESFLTPPGDLSDLVSAAVEAETGLRPDLSTSGGTSDARFIKDHCAVVEFGLVGQTMHQIDEHVAEADIRGLTAIYRRVLEGYFSD
ncbi:MAG: succinyl-diaminopimelate desuccinylase [Pseudomonadota bacterium]